MVKTIEVGNKKVTLSNNVTWLIKYRNQYGKDILPTIMPVLATVLDLFETIASNLNGKKEIGLEDFVKGTNGDAITDAMVHLSGLEFVDFMNIFWSMAKTADDSIPDEEEYFAGFDSFPMDEIGPAVFDLITKGLMSAKNLERLQKTLKIKETVLKSTPTPSSLPESKED